MSDTTSNIKQKLSQYNFDQKRPQKHMKMNDNCFNASSTLCSCDLPAEIWASICECLPYTDVKNLAASSKFMLNQVLPSISIIFLFSAQELSCVHARRMPEVQVVHVYCLLKESKGENLVNVNRVIFCRDTGYRLVPYLTCFPRLTTLVVGALVVKRKENENVETNYIWDGLMDRLEPSEHLCLSQLDSIPNLPILARNLCGAIQSGALTKLTQIDGLIHARRAATVCGRNPHFPRSNITCWDCSQVLQCFPSQWLMEARGSVLCCPAKERLQQVIKRGESHRFQADSYVPSLIRSGFFKVEQSMSPPFLAIGFMKSVISEVHALVDLNLINPKLVDPNIFYDAIKSFKKNSGVPIRFSEPDFKSLSSLGFLLEQYRLENAGILMYTPERWNIPAPFPFHFPPGEGGGAGRAGIEIRMNGMGVQDPHFADILGQVRLVMEQQLQGDEANDAAAAGAAEPQNGEDQGEANAVRLALRAGLAAMGAAIDQGAVQAVRPENENLAERNQQRPNEMVFAQDWPGMFNGGVIIGGIMNAMEIPRDEAVAAARRDGAGAAAAPNGNHPQIIMGNPFFEELGFPILGPPVIPPLVFNRRQENGQAGGQAHESQQGQHGNPQ
jgi:hypothetical protein